MTYKPSTSDIPVGVAQGGQTMFVGSGGTLGADSGSTVDLSAATTTLGPASLTNPTITGSLTDSNATVSAAGTSSQANATALTKDLNNVGTVAANSGVALPAAVAGRDVLVANNGANALNVYPTYAGGSGTDAINGLGANIPTVLPVGQLAWFSCTVTGTWNTQVITPRLVNTAINTVGAGTLTAAGLAGGLITRGGAQSGTPFTDTTDTPGNIIGAVHGAAVGQSWICTILNNTNAVMTVSGASGVTVSGVTTIAPDSWVDYLVTYSAASTITMQSMGSGPATYLPPAQFTSINVTTGTLAAGQASGAAFTALFSTNNTPGTQHMRTVAQVLADTPGLAVGMSYILRITNSGTGTLTLATDGSTQFTMTGTMTVLTNTFRDFCVTINSATTGTVQSIGTGSTS